MSDKVEKDRFPKAVDNIAYLISELKKCRAENEMFQGDVVRLQQTNRRLNRRCTEMEGALKKAEAEVKRLKAMLAIGHFVIRE